MSDRDETSAGAEHVIQMTPIMLRPKEAAQALGICKRTFDDLVANGEIPFVNVGQGEERVAKRFMYEDLLAWARARRHGKAIGENPRGEACTCRLSG